MPNEIDITTALSILSERTTQMDVRDDSSNGGGGGGGCGCCHHHGGANSEIPDNMKRMGQVIDLNNDNNNTTSNNGSSEGESSLSEEEKQKQKEEEERIKSERVKRQQEIQNELQSMSNKELLQAVLNVQEERVATYKAYESGLMVVLDSGNMTSYPNICSKVTASFAVLSETVKGIQSILQSRERNDLVTLIRQLQNLEREKLQLTAAHHLERIRERNQQQQLLQLAAQGGDDDDGEGTSGELRIQKLLKEGVESLQQKINKTIESINDVIDDIRCSLLEEVDD